MENPRLLQSVKFKVGEFVFCEFQLRQIKSIDGDRITETTNGISSHSGHDLSDRCFKLSLEIKNASDTVDLWSKKLHELRGLNFPDIHQFLVTEWVHICTQLQAGLTSSCLYEKLESFCKKTIELSKNTSVEGVRIFK